MTTLSAALAAATEKFAAAGIGTPRLDARLLLEWATGRDTADLISRPETTLTAHQAADFENAVCERTAGRPVARIVGEKEFWGLGFYLSEDTLVPRPDTETLVEAVLARIERPQALWTGTLCDLGTGSGAILIALLSELPLARGVGVDLSADAIATARRNSDRHDVARRAAWHVADYADWRPSDATERFDIIVSNPPYIADSDIGVLASEVRDHDPHRALNGGIDGLDAYRTLAGRLPDLLRSDGLAALELGFGQAEAVAELTTNSGLEVIGVEPDIAGIARVLLAGPMPTVAPLQQLRC